MKKVILVVPIKYQNIGHWIDKDSIDCVYTIGEFNNFMRDGAVTIIDSKKLALGYSNYEGILYIVEF